MKIMPIAIPIIIPRVIPKLKEKLESFFGIESSKRVSVLEAVS